jgi:outer membrane receptor protein involved in Fe transport
VRWSLVGVVGGIGLLGSLAARAQDPAQTPTGGPPQAPVNGPAPEPAGDPSIDPSIDPKYESIVVATTPLHGSLLPSDRVAANVQTANSAAIEGNHNLDLSEFMNESLGSVTINQVQENPLQPDLQYRGFVASPVLGASEGISVFLNGVRLNEPFGDIVNWDLIPPSALQSLNLMPGSNPLFGLNTLGGALSMETKTGFTAPGGEAELSGGSWGRRIAEVQIGGHNEHWGAFGAGRFFTEDGWREHSPSQAFNGFFSTTYQNDGTTLDLSIIGASTSMAGIGASPVQLLAQDRAAVFTYPDETHNRMLMAILRGDRPLSPTSHLSATAFYRLTRTLTANGDQGEWDACTTPGQTGNVCADDGTTVILDKAGNPVPFDPNNLFDGSDNTTYTHQIGFGLSAQGSFEAPLAGHENHLFVGGSADEGLIRFRSQTVLATLDDTRGTVDTDFVDPTSLVSVDSTVRNLGLYASDTFAPLPALFLTLSGRFNLSTLSLQDQLGGDLSGDHQFQRVNPAAGVSYQPRPQIGVYGSYSESTRAPTSMELTCASPTDPCRLPNEFVADPPLAQVVARTFEAGVRGRLGGGRGRAFVDYALSAFHTANTNDILFISSGPLTNEGYFANVGDTLRQGIEARLHGRVRLGARSGRLEWSAAYTYLDATFQTSFSSPSANHPLAMDGQIPVVAGDHLPSIPAHVGKASLTWVLPFGLSVGGTVIGNSGQYYRGDEANLLPQIPGYVIVNLRADYVIARWISVFAKADNVFDADYASFGVLGDATGVPAFQSFTDPRFQGPGAPRAGWLGVTLRY